MPESDTSITVADLAKEVDGTVDGDGSLVLQGVAGIRDAGPGDLTFVANRKYASNAAQTRASAVLVGEDWDHDCPAALIKVENPDAALQRRYGVLRSYLLLLLPAFSPSAVVGEGCRIGEGVHIGPCCILEDGCSVGDGSVIRAGTFLGYQAVIGKEALLYPGVMVREFVEIGDRVIVHSGSVIGSDGFGYTVEADGSRTKIPQVGTVIIHDDAEIGANVTIDRARFGKTVIGKGVKIDNLVQVAHNVVIEDHAVIVAQVAIAGSAVIGSKAIVAGQAGIAGHIEVGAGAIVGGQAAVTKSVPAGQFVSGYPAMPHVKTTRLQAHVSQLPKMKKALKVCEERLDRLENSGSES